MAALRHRDLDLPDVTNIQPTPRPFDYNRVDFLFPDFTRDKDRYKLAQAYWQVVFERAVNAALIPETEQWRLHWHYNPRRDGQAIFSAICRARKLAIRINQQSPTDATPGFTWGTELLPEGKRSMVVELVITCVPSRATMPRVFPLLISWLRGDTLPQEFEARYECLTGR